MQHLLMNTLSSYSVSYIHDLSPHHLHGHTALVYQLLQNQMAVHSLWSGCILSLLVMNS